MKEKSTILSIGFDDTDSPKGMCTTYLGFKLAGLLQKEGVEFVDYPRLVRFNPNIPWKTRGNGAVGLRVRTSRPSRIKKLVIDMVSRYSETQNGANPAVVFYDNDIPKKIREFSKSALWKLVERGYVKKFIRENKIDSFCIGNGQGLVGALGVIGYEFGDSTLELLSYRKRSKFGTQRKISEQSVLYMQEQTHPRTFNSYDKEKHKVMITPHGPDPVFYGIRGSDPYTLFEASRMVKTAENLDGYMLFQSNQGTSDHLQNNLDVHNLKAYMSGVMTGIISKKPMVRLGGHVFFGITVAKKEIICAIYKESGMTSTMMNLCVGDAVTVGGGVRRATRSNPMTLNVEFIRISHLVKVYKQKNPPCTKCNKRMKSKGVGQGFECIRCKSRADSKISEQIHRQIKLGLYLPVTSSQRHLTRPYARQGQKNKIKFDGSLPWIHTFDN